jgi:hypothetical protein
MCCRVDPSFIRPGAGRLAPSRSASAAGWTCGHLARPALLAWLGREPALCTSARISSRCTEGRYITHTHTILRRAADLPPGQRQCSRVRVCDFLPVRAIMNAMGALLWTPGDRLGLWASALSLFRRYSCVSESCRVFWNPRPTKDRSPARTCIRPRLGPGSFPSPGCPGPQLPVQIPPTFPSVSSSKLYASTAFASRLSLPSACFNRLMPRSNIRTRTVGPPRRPAPYLSVLIPGIVPLSQEHIVASLHESALRVQQWAQIADAKDVQQDVIKILHWCQAPDMVGLPVAHAVPLILP